MWGDKMLSLGRSEFLVKANRCFKVLSLLAKRQRQTPDASEGSGQRKDRPVRFAADELDRVLEAATASNQTVSRWIRSMLTSVTQG